VLDFEKPLQRSGFEQRRFEGLWGANFGFLKLLRPSIETLSTMQQMQRLIVSYGGMYEGDYLTFRILHTNSA